MRQEAEVLTRAELVRLLLSQAVDQREQGNHEPELDLHILSLLDQLETLLWVLEPDEDVVVCLN